MSYSGVKGIDVTRGYIDFFEPDVLVETKPGMADKLGWENSRRFMQMPRVIPLSQLYELDDRGETQFNGGIDIYDVICDLYDNEFKYERRHKPSFAKIAARQGDAFFDVVCGRYPEDEHLSYINNAYDDVFSPSLLPADASTAICHLTEGLLGPFWITGHDLEEGLRRSHRDQPFFVFDPTCPSDAVDYWNFRLVDRRAIPINVNWFGDCATFMRTRIEQMHRPIPGNQFGTKFHSTACFASSISEEQRRELLKQHLSGLPEQAVFGEHNPVLWDVQRRRNQGSETKILAAGKPVSFDEHTDIKGAVRIPAPRPMFVERSERYTKRRWINIIVPSASYDDANPAILYPSNLWSPVYPSLAYGENLRIGREGWILQMEYSIGYTLLHLQTARDAIIGWLKVQGIEAQPSEAGQIAIQVIIAAGGLLASGMFADHGTLKLLGEMAESHTQVIRDGKRVTTSLPDRSKHINTVRQHFVQREKRSFGFWARLSYFIERSVFRAGLKVQCPICGYQNWLDLDAIRYHPICTRCLNSFVFSQTPEHLHSVDWFYRVVGPFAAPDFARGSYAVALTLRCLSGPINSEMTWSTGLELQPLNCEVDFVAWYRDRGILNDERDEPQLVLGEVKSFGRNAVSAETVSNIRKVAEQFPGAIMVVSSLREISDYSADEIARLRELAQWGRVRTQRGMPRNPLIVLTATELFCLEGINHAWKSTDPDSARKYIDLRDLGMLAEMTQQRYLGLMSYWEEQVQQQYLPMQRQRLLGLIRTRFERLAS